ncbi:MAG TPA: c-type cytochrome biogenesis protein CcmI [Chloroflexota bacterium]
MMLLIALLVVVATCVYVISPLWRRPDESIEESTGALVEDVTRQREALYRALRELEFDHQVGHLTLEDYESLQAHYRRRALLLLEAEETIDRRRIEHEIEEEVRRRLDEPEVRRPAPTDTAGRTL